MTAKVPSLVVGFDGSGLAVRALDWALSEAGRTGGRVEAVTVWPGPVDPVAAASIDARLDDAARRHPAVALAQCRRRGVVAEEVLAAAEGADLLVLGSHGAGRRFAELFGSVTAYCVRRAPCPVVVIPAAARVPVAAPA